MSERSKLAQGGIINPDEIKVNLGTEKILPLNGQSIVEAIKNAFAAAGVKTVTKDNIKPDHYKVGGMEPIEYMKLKMSKEAFNGFLLGNVIKYTSRFEHKNGLEDLKKAQWYLNRLVSENE
ncbi:DUF3310 domain-containing protein [Paenibacillus sp. GCM10023248]|uniref:DUF3310 domain-containing protein n=1 Tax=unclassified Paenibacillus TaxID=185978 RepID=UPI0023798CB1|nr:DUF3310 domain-containing protein [Paenibacillus sp. MAHUQ-63]MDD9266067.1 DUF3310 domain-containing protein [Paenibacillus sp. MAHUQ-63]